MTKVCSKCGKEKDKSEFYKDKTKPDGLSYWCKKCTLKYGKKHYENNRDTYIKNKNSRQERSLRFIWLVKVFGSCQKCGESHPACLTFHHKNPKNKEYNVSQMKDCSVETIKSEIRKCKILCFNCHMKLEYKMRA